MLCAECACVDVILRDEKEEREGERREVLERE
jgi:hypothetical protein